MAKVSYGGKWITAKVYRLPSQKAVYEYQKLYHHKTKALELMWWQGEYPDGKLTDMITVPKAEFPHWHRRIEAGEAKPELQRASEYSMQISRCPEDVIDYLNRLDDAENWHKGQRVRKA